jgi:hypothetical protein
MTLAVLLLRLYVAQMDSILRILLSIFVGAAVYTGSAVLFMSSGSVLAVITFLRRLSKGSAFD